MQLNRIPQSVSDLEKDFRTIGNDRWTVRLNMLDKQVIEILLHAEKKCSKLRIREVEYSPEISNTAEKWHLQRIALKVAEGDR